jgi:membrane dipeptidase
VETAGMVDFNYATFYIRDDGTASTDLGWEPLLRHLDNLIEHLGEDHVGLGSDRCGRTDSQAEPG